MAESNEELKSLLMRVKEEKEKAALKLNIIKTKIMASGPGQMSLWPSKCCAGYNCRDGFFLVCAILDVCLMGNNILYISWVTQGGKLAKLASNMVVLGFTS